jgi:hypothetical protein
VKQSHADLFAGAAFALNEDGHIGLRHPLQFVSDGLHRRSFSEDNVQRRQVEGRGGFGIVDQGHFFLSA